MWIAEWSPDSGVEDSVCFNTFEESQSFVRRINKTLGIGKGMSAYWYNYEYKSPTPIPFLTALEKYKL